MLKILSLRITSYPKTTVSYLQKGHAHTETNKLPRITLPHRILQKLEKEKLKNILKKHKRPYVLKGHENLVIACKQKEYNHYKNQYYLNFSTKDLASHGWKHYKSKGDYFTINAFQKSPAFDTDVASFNHLSIQEAIIEALKDLQITKPTNIQSLVIPRLLKGANVLCAAETGNGKTLSYLIPVLEKILRLKNSETKDRYSKKELLNRPVAVVVAPTRELVAQIYEVAKSLGERLGVSVDMKVGGHGTQRILREMQVKPMDILISSPGILSKLLSNNFLDLRHLSYTIFDEADTLFDDSFCELIIRVIKKMRISVEKPVSIDNEVVMLRKGVEENQRIEELSEGGDGSLVERENEMDMNDNDMFKNDYNSVQNDNEITKNNDEMLENEEIAVDGKAMGVDGEAGMEGGLQVVMCGATMPQGLKKKLSEIIDMEAMEIITTRHLHHISPHIPHKFIRLGASQKIDRLSEILHHNQKKGIKTIVFCNKPSTVYFILHSLSNHPQPDPLQSDHPQPDPLQSDHPQPDPLQSDHPQPDPLQSDHPQPDPLQPHQSDHPQPDPLQPHQPEHPQTYSENPKNLQSNRINSNHPKLPPLTITSIHSRIPVPLRREMLEGFKRGECNAMVCTDIASRGLDTTQAQQVINYDFPNFLSDYVHRVGRVGRVGGVSGSSVLNFITHVWDVDMVWKIEGSVRQKTELPNVNANIKRKLVGLAEVRRLQEDLKQESLDL